MQIEEYIDIYIALCDERREDISSFVGIRNETGLNVTELERNETEAAVNVVTGVCQHIPSGIHVSVMYAVAGNSNNNPLYQIVGAKIRLVQ